MAALVILAWVFIVGLLRDLFGLLLKIDILSYGQEGLSHIVGRLGARLQIYVAELVRQIDSLFLADLSLAFQVIFIAKDYDIDILLAVDLDFAHPVVGDVIITFAIGDVKGQDNSICTPEIACYDWLEALLPCGVKDL